VITLRGAVFLGTSLALTCAGLLRIDGPMTSLGGAGLLILALAWCVGKRNLSGLEVHLQTPARVFADTRFQVALTMKNERALMDGFQIHQELRLSKAARIHTHTPWVAARSSATVKLSGSIAHRGAQREHPCLLRSSFPLGLISHEKELLAIKEILVFPKAITPREFFTSGASDDAYLGDGFQASSAPGEPRSLRPFRPGDSAKQLHWPATIRSQACGRGPLVRESDPPGLRPAKVTVIFHSFGTDGALIRTDHFERALSLLCGTLRHLRTLGVPATLTADFLAWKELPTFQPVAWSEALTILAEATRAHETEAHDVQAAINHAARDHALIVISDMPPASWAGSLQNQKNLPLIIDIAQHAYSKKALNFRAS